MTEVSLPSAGADEAALLEHDLEVVGVGGRHHRPALASTRGIRGC